MAACSSTPAASATPSPPPFCQDVSGCQGYQTCCNPVTLGDCHYTDPSGNTAAALPPSCATEPTPPPEDFDAAPWPPTNFVGTWTPIAGSGQSQCGNGGVQTQGPDSNEVDVLVQTGPDTLAWFERDGCQQITLRFNGNTAVAAPSGQQCAASEDGYDFELTFSSLTFTLVVPDAGSPVEPSGDGGEDAGEGGAGGDEGGAPAIPFQMTMDLIDTAPVGDTVCGLTAHYLLERAQ